MNARTVLAFDYGRRRIGVACGQEYSRHAQPLTSIRCASTGPAWGDIDRLITDWRPDLLLIGLPLRQDHTPQPLIPLIENFAAGLATRYQRPISYVDEALSSWAATQDIIAQARRAGRARARVKEQVDAGAAAIILQTWFTQHYERS